MNKHIRAFLKEEDGVTALEYGILAAIVAAAIVAVFGSRLQTLFGNVFTKLDDAVSNSGSAGTGGTGGGTGG